MILHIFVDTTLFTKLPGDIITVSLKFTVDKETTLNVTSPVNENSEAILSKTLHVPLVDDVTKTSELVVDAVAYSVKGVSLPLGSGSITVSPMEHGSAKQINFHNGSSPTGNVKFSVFYYRFPMDVNDFQQSGATLATDQQQKFMREYSFLQKRRMRWGDSKASSWNINSERLLAEDPAVAANTDLAWAQGRGPPHTRDRDRESSGRDRDRGQDSSRHHPYGQPRASKFTNKKAQKKQSIVELLTARGAPKLRKTCLSVSYGGVEWPNNPGDKEEKLLQRLHVAEQRRLQLLHSAAEESRLRNRRQDVKIAGIRKRRSSVSPQEHERLRRLLRDKEEALRALRAELQSERSTQRRAEEARRRSPVREQGLQKMTLRAARGRSRENSSDLHRRQQQSSTAVFTSRGETHHRGEDGHRHRFRRRRSRPTNPSYLAATSSWAAGARLCFPPARTNNPNSNCTRACCCCSSAGLGLGARAAPSASTITGTEEDWCGGRRSARGAVQGRRARPQRRAASLPARTDRGRGTDRGRDRVTSSEWSSGDNASKGRGRGSESAYYYEHLQHPLTLPLDVFEAGDTDTTSASSSSADLLSSSSSHWSVPPALPHEHQQHQHQHQHQHQQFESRAGRASSLSSSSASSSSSRGERGGGDGAHLSQILASKSAAAVTFVHQITSAQQHSKSHTSTSTNATASASASQRSNEREGGGGGSGSRLDEIIAKYSAPAKQQSAAVLDVSVDRGDSSRIDDDASESSTYCDSLANDENDENDESDENGEYDRDDIAVGDDFEHGGSLAQMYLRALGRRQPLR